MQKWRPFCCLLSFDHAYSRSDADDERCVPYHLRHHITAAPRTLFWKGCSQTLVNWWMLCASFPHQCSSQLDLLQNDLDPFLPSTKVAVTICISLPPFLALESSLTLYLHCRTHAHLVAQHTRPLISFRSASLSFLKRQSSTKSKSCTALSSLAK